ncbi:hypothetical protein [Zoogloea sp.]|uniref:hypothetical protein n=1 Tax=Zoogloea sp. TaxID=49181 RepID=UPI0026311501|nr:hypothetical protein [uncultured Zoogloea sp.]
MHTPLSRALHTLRPPLGGLLLILLATTAHAGPWRADPDNSRGWELMSPAERIEHQRRLRSFTDYEACRAYQQAHHARMEARAQAEGRSLKPRARSPCNDLRERGDLR